MICFLGGGEVALRGLGLAKDSNFLISGLGADVSITKPHVQHDLQNGRIPGLKHVT